MQEIINKILSEAIYAPSGDNSQPWEFACSKSNIEIYNLPKKDNPLFNFEQRGSYIAHGALLENISILATKYKLGSEIILFPEKNNLNHTASVTLKTDPSLTVDPLADFIKLRCTNRKKYHKFKLGESQKQALLQISQKLNFGQLLLTEKPEAIASLAKAASSAERVMLEYKPLHQAFFHMICWNKKQETAHQGSMLIDTFEFLPPQKLIFKWFSHWQASKILRLLGLPAFVAKENAKTYASSSAIGAVLMPQLQPENCIQTGRLLQRIWLTAAQLGLNIQPIAGILYLAQRLEAGQMENLAPSLHQCIENSVQNIYKAFSQPSAHITMMFRLGKADPPSAHSAKFPPRITYRTY